MDLENITEDTTVTIKYEAPSVKDQLITAAVGMGVAVAVPLALGGIVLAGSAIASGASKIKAKFSKKNKETDLEPTE